jgi:hypothetical protein
MKVLLHVDVFVVSIARDRPATAAILLTGTVLFFALTVFETLHSGRFDELAFVEGALGLALGHALVRPGSEAG